MKIKKIMNFLEFLYPVNYAESWDNVGLLIGDERRDASRILCALELTNDVIEEAIEKNIDLIITHHPIIFDEIKTLNYKDPNVRKYVKLIKENIAVYSMHTNVDVSQNGMSDWVSQLLELSSTQVFIPTKGLELYSLEIECNQKNLYVLLDLLKKIGVGQQNNLIQDANIRPEVKYYQNEIDVEKQTDILIVSSTLSQDLTSKVQYELNKNNFKKHKITKLSSIQKKIGIGKVGYIKPCTLEDLAFKFKEIYGLEYCKLVGNREQIIKKIAIVPGSGKEFVKQAKIQGCDVLITGDVGYHDAQYAISSNIALLDPGHNIEIVFNDAISQLLGLFEELTVLPSEIDTNPFEVL